MKIAVIGAGGVGGYLAAKLWKGGNEVVVVARGEHLEAMERSGLILRSPDGDIHVRDATFCSDLTGAGPFELIVIAVKSFDTSGAAAVARQAMSDATMILTIQNGVENEQLLAGLLGEQHVVGGVAYIASTIHSAGVILHEWGHPLFKMGELDGTMTARCSRLEDVFRRSAIGITIVEDIARVLWEKWIFICGAGGMTAYTRLPMGGILGNREHRRTLEDVIAEATAVARAKGIGSLAGYEEKAMAHCARLDPGSTSSMHYDVTHGKRNEVEALNGAAVRFGKEEGIPTPENGKIYEALRRENPPA